MAALYSGGETGERMGALAARLVALDPARPGARVAPGLADPAALQVDWAIHDAAEKWWAEKLSAAAKTDGKDFGIGAIIRLLAAGAARR